LRYDDQQVGIEWPTLEVPLCISEKDQKGQALKDIEINF
jgi:dTDP-4-dehydrorhamnose 3,5-epimerase-like enzyme